MGSHIKIPYIETPLIKSANLSRAAGCNVYLKLENLQPSGSFKSRGIGHFMVEQLKALRASAPSALAHFYSSSGGNAGLACVHAALTLGCQATVVVPLTTTEFMMDKLRAAGATDVVQIGASWQEADDHLTGTLMPAAVAAGGATPVYVPPFDAQGIWDGNAGITREVLKQMGGAVDHYAVTAPTAPDGLAVADTTPNVDAIVCSVGGGGLFSGIMQGVEEYGLQHRTRVVAVETEGADALHQSVQRMEQVTLPAITSLATSLGARRVCRQAFEYGLRDNVSTAVLSDAEAIRACRRFADEERFVVELACGVCAALIYNGQIKEHIPGFNENSTVVVVVCGGSNMSYDIMEKYMAGLQ